jgi:hypothetical protein
MEKCLLKSDVLTMENTAEEMVFQQWRNIVEQWCFSNGKKKRNIVEQWCFSNGKKGKILLNSGVSTMGFKMGKGRNEK